MTTEAGTRQCYLLIKTQNKIEEAIQLIVKLNNTEHINQQLISVHNQLDGMHELQRRVVQKKIINQACISSKEISIEFISFIFCLIF